MVYEESVCYREGVRVWCWWTEKSWMEGEETESEWVRSGHCDNCVEEEREALVGGSVASPVWC